MAAAVAPAVHTQGESFRVRGLHLTDHHFTVPLDHRGAVPGTLSVFLREVAPADKAGDGSLPWLIFLQGGPGFESPRPTEAGGWIKAACDKGFRVGLLDSASPSPACRILKRGASVGPAPALPARGQA